MPRGRILALLALLAIVTYLPALRQPLIEDDFHMIGVSAQLGSPHALWQLAASPFALRSTTIWLSSAIYHLFAMNPLPYYCANIALHVLNTWLMYALGAWRPIGFTAAAWAAAFFAVAERHHEAIMWFSGGSELLLFFFGMLAFLCWVRFLESDAGRWRWYAASLLAFAISLISKESAVIFAALFLLPLVVEGRWREARYTLPVLLLAAAAVLVIWHSRTSSFRFQDRSFSLQAPFWLILPKNVWRMLWPSGVLGIATFFGPERCRRLAAIGLVWMGVALIPYSFLTYNTEIPSRQTYLASAGLAWITAAGLLALQERFAAYRRPITAAVCAVALLANLGYLWTKKRRQFAQRAEPTQELIALARRTSGPIFVRCFPRPRVIAEGAVHLGAAQPERAVIWDEAEARSRGGAVEFCYPGK